MNITKITFLIILFLCLCKETSAQNLPAPTGLTVNLLTSTEKVSLNGYPVNLTPEVALSRNEMFQFTEISTHNPQFGWIVPGETNNTIQTAYQILVADNRQKLFADSANLWDSGKVISTRSTNITYTGEPIKPGIVCFWKVRTWDNHGRESSYSNGWA